MLRLFFCALVLGAFFSTTKSDRGYPQDFFQNPVPSLPLRLSGTFAELRADHFHAGIDIKGGAGVPIHAAGAGRVYRIRVNGDGYGNALYLEHPNGYTTVYAHLKEFAPALQAYIRQAQEEQQSFVVDLYPAPEAFPVQRGQLVGKMGNTGHSFGPHLHFEIRETASDKPLNPLLFGLSATDRLAPQLFELKCYSFGEHPFKRSAQRLPLSLRQGEYRPTAGDTLWVDYPQVGLGLKTYDQMDGVSNRNGIFALEMQVDGQTHYRFKAEGVGFAETRYINAHVDYEERLSRNAYFHRCFLLPGNQLSMYESVQARGLIDLPETGVRQVVFKVQDVWGNTATGHCWVGYKPSSTALTTPSVDPPYNYVMPFHQVNAIDNYDLQVSFPVGVFYEDCYFYYQSLETSPRPVFSRVHRLHHSRVPIHDYFTIGIRPTHLPARLQSKAFVASLPSSGKPTNYGVKWEKNLLYAQARQLGDYAIMVDTVAPKIQPERFLADMRKVGSFSFIIGDNVKNGGTTPDLQFRAEIDGRWILMTYDEKYGRLSYRFEPGFAAGNHQFVLTVTDAMGNQQRWSKNFRR